MDTPIYEMMVTHWHGENPEEIKKFYDGEELVTAASEE